MSKTSMVYRGFTIEATTFELAESGRYTSSLMISAPGSVQTRIVDLPVTHHLFTSPADAMSMTVAEGRMLVDFFAMDRATGATTDR